MFTALVFGMSSGVVYLLVRRWLPHGRLDGVTYGALLSSSLRLASTHCGRATRTSTSWGWDGRCGVRSSVIVHAVVLVAVALAAIPSCASALVDMAVRQPYVWGRHRLPTPKRVCVQADRHRFDRLKSAQQDPSSRKRDTVQMKTSVSAQSR